MSERDDLREKLEARVRRLKSQGLLLSNYPSADYQKQLSFTGVSVGGMEWEFWNDRS